MIHVLHSADFAWIDPTASVTQAYYAPFITAMHASAHLPQGPSDPPGALYEAPKTPEVIGASLRSQQDKALTKAESYTNTLYLLQHALMHAALAVAASTRPYGATAPLAACPSPSQPLP
jgi:hypothetical protein